MSWLICCFLSPRPGIRGPHTWNMLLCSIVQIVKFSTSSPSGQTKQRHRPAPWGQKRPPEYFTVGEVGGIGRGAGGTGLVRLEERQAVPARAAPSGTNLRAGTGEQVLPEPEPSAGEPPAAGARPFRGAAARRRRGLRGGALLGRRAALRARARLALGPRGGPRLGWRSDHGWGRSWLDLGPRRGPRPAAGAGAGTGAKEVGDWAGLPQGQGAGVWGSEGSFRHRPSAAPTRRTWGRGAAAPGPASPGRGGDHIWEVGGSKHHGPGRACRPSRGAGEQCAPGPS